MKTLPIRALSTMLILLGTLAVAGCSAGFGVQRTPTQPAARSTQTATRALPTFRPPTLKPPTRQPTGAGAAITRTPTAPAPVQQAGQDWRQYQRPEDGFTLSLPPAWQEVDYRAQSRAIMIGSLRTLAPALLASFLADSRSGPTTDVRFFAVDEAARGMPASLSVIYRPAAPGTLTLQEFSEVNRDILKELSRSISQAEEAALDLPSGHALRQHYSLSLDLPGLQPVGISITQYAITRARDGRFCLLIFTGDPANQEADGPLFDRIAGSFQWLD